MARVPPTLPSGVMQTFKASIIAQHTTNATAFVFDYGYMQTGEVSTHLDTGIAAGNFQTLVQAKYQACLPDCIQIMRYRFSVEGGPYFGEIGYVEASSIFGTTTNPQIFPQEVAIALKRHCGHASKHDRGRVFFGPVMSDVFGSAVPNQDLVTSTSDLIALSDLGKASLTSGGVTLLPCILANTGNTTGHTVIHTSIAPVFVHRKSRRLRTGA